MTENIKKIYGLMIYITGFTVVFFLINAIAYLLGYWGTFDINAFDFGSIYDVARTAFTPKFFVFLLVLIGYSIVFGYTPIEVKIPMNEEGVCLGKLLNYLNRFLNSSTIFSIIATVAILCFGLVMLVVRCYFHLHSPLPMNLFYSLFFLVIVFVLILVMVFKNTFLAKFIPCKRIYCFVIVVTTLIPAAFFTIGFNDAWSVLSGDSYKCINQLQLKNHPFTAPNGPLKYLGRLGDSILLMSQDNSSTYVVGLDKLDFIKLSTCKKNELKKETRKIILNKPEQQK